MIPEYAITEWRNTVPWNASEQVEQDLIICRALTEMYKDEYLASHLAFRGGTALHKLYLSPQPRYSEDIDLVQIEPEPIKETIDKIRDVLAFLGEPKVKQKKHNCDKVLECYHKYMEFVVDNPPSQKEFLQNMEIKMQDDEFLGDTELLLRPDENFHPQEAYELVKSELIERI